MCYNNDITKEVIPMNINKHTEQSVVLSDEVIAKIVSLAALDVDGVCAMVDTPDIKKMLRPGSTKSVHVKTGDGSLIIDLYIKLNMGVKIASVCEKVQQSVKKSVQNMTNSAVTQVNVHVVDIDIPKTVE